MKWFVVILFVVAVVAIAASIWNGASSRTEKQPSVGQAKSDEALTASIPSARTETRSGPREIYPDPTRTPGVTNPDINQENIADTICNSGWSTKSIRPPSSHTSRLKREQIRDWNLPDTDARDYEEDHFIPLELGGHPSDQRNLWPESYDEPGARQKDKVENQLHREVCDGNLTLEQAQRIIVEDWYSCYLRLENHELCK